jgi:glycosyltransferase involved in cell wall biosynthesis
MVKASAAIRCYNAESSIERAAKSLLTQDAGGSVEVLIIDDNSTDDSWKRIETFKDRARIFKLCPKRGAIDAAHFALEQATGEYFFALDADDYAEPEYVRTMVAALEQAPTAAFAYCDYFEEEEGTGSRCAVAIEDYLTRMLACNAVFRTAILRSEGFWDASLLLPEYDLLVRLLSKYSAAYVPRPLYHYCRHTNSMTRQNGFIERAMRQLAVRHAARLGCESFDQLRISMIGAKQ